MARMTGAEIIIKCLEKRGIDTIAGIPGGANLPLYDALYKSKIRHILARHEQGAGFIAQGQARSTGKAAVCFATSGPGATNLLTAIADAKLDSIPVIGITGQVPSSMIGTDAFQEVDTYGMTLPITKHNFFVRSAEELLCVMPEAFKIAESGRPGPVVIDVPKDVQKEVIEVDALPEMDWKALSEEMDTHTLDAIAQQINQAKKPVMIIGGGIIAADAEAEVKTLSEKGNIPVASTLMGLGAFDPDAPLYLGMLGMHGARYTNYLMNEADLVIALGIRFDDRATGKADAFCPNATIIHIDIDQSEIDKIKNAHFSLAGDVKKALEKILPLIEPNSRSEWVATIEKQKTEHPFVLPPGDDPFNPVTVIQKIAELADEDTIITSDVGQHQMWAAQIYPFKKPRTWLTSGGLGTMGFGVPTAIGAALANPDKKVICISGDGSFLMNIQELATIADLNLNMAVVIFNNNHLGLVRQQQELFYDKNYIASRFDSSPDFAAIAKGFGVPSTDLTNSGKVAEALESMMQEKGPRIINIPIDHEENVYPMVSPGAANTEMIGG